MTTAPLSGLTATWNSAGTTFTAIKMNVTDTASAADSVLMDLQVGGTSRFAIGKTGGFSTIGSAFGIYNNGAQILMGGAGDLIVARDAADTLALRRTTNAQTFRIYNTFTDASNYERGELRWNANNFELIAASAGTGATRPLRFGINNSAQWQINTNGHFTAVTDNTYDIGASGANRPRDILVARNVWADGNVTAGGSAARVGTNGVVAASSASIGFSSTTSADGSLDLTLTRDAADTLALRRTTNAQTFRIYNTFTDASNYERGTIGWSGNSFRIITENSGTGIGRRLQFGVAGSAQWEIDGNLLAVADNTRDIGASGANRPRNVFWAGYQEMSEMTAPAAPATNNVRIYAEDNGSGKTRLMARFATGAAVQIAIEP